MNRILRAALVVSVLSALAACGGSDDKAGGKGSDKSWFDTQGKAPFRVALVTSMAQPVMQYGTQLRAGVTQAMDDINDKGGVLGSAVMLRAVDDHCDPQYAQAVARGLAAQHISIVIGHLCPAATLSAAPIYGDGDMLLIAPTTTDTALTDDAAARHVTDIIRVAPRDDAQGPALAKHVMAHYPGAPVALIQDGTHYGRTIVDSTRNALVAAGVKPALDETVVPADEADASLVARLKAARIGVVIYGGATADGAALLREMRREGSKAAFGGGNTLFAPDFWRLAGRDAEGVFTSWLPDPVKLMHGTYRSLDTGSRGGLIGGLGVGVKGYTLYGYAAFQVFAEAAERAKSIDPMVIAKTLRSGSYDTILGTLTFDAKGDAHGLGFTVYGWHDGGYVTFDEG